jgi:RNA polymerase sigma-70 factor, ECF subfamily
MLLVADTLAPMTDPEPTGGHGAVRAADARDRARFEEVALAHAEHLYRIAVRLTGSPQAAEDLVQETYLRAFRAWRSFRPGTNLAAWLATIMRNTNMDELRRQSRRPQSEPLDEQGDYFLYNRLTETGREPQEQVLARMSGGGVVAALGQVPANFREVVVLVDVGEFSYAEAAEILGIPIGTVMSRLYRGRRLLKQALAEKAEEEGA